MSTRMALCLALALPALLSASRAHAAAGGKSSSLIPVWEYDETPRGFILDSTRLDSRILDAMAGKLGAKAYSRGGSGPCYERRAFGRSVYDYCFRADWTRARWDTLVVDSNAWSVDTIRLRQGRLFGHYSFESWRRGTPRENNLSPFLYSAYHQELYPAYRGRDSLFTAPPSQNRLGLWLRGTLSPTWAYFYASKADPFTGLSKQGDFATYAYLVDGGFSALALIALTAILIDGKAETRSQVLWYAGGAHTAISLGILLPILSIDLGESIRFRASGYRFPRGLRSGSD